MWLMATILQSTDLEHFYHHRKFYGTVLQPRELKNKLHIPHFCSALEGESFRAAVCKSRKTPGSPWGTQFTLAWTRSLCVCVCVCPTHTHSAHTERTCSVSAQHGTKLIILPGGGPGLCKYVSASGSLDKRL